MEYRERQHAAMFCSAVQLGVAVFMQNIGLDGQKATVWSCWHSVLFYLCCAHWTDLRSLHWHSQAQSTGREMLQAARHTKYLQCLQYQLCCTSAWSFYSDSGCTVEESVCLSGAGRQHSNPHARRRLDARVELVYQCLRNLQCLVAFTAGRNTVHDTTVPAAAVICNLLLSSAHHVFLYWSGQTDLHCAACTWLNLSVAQTQCMQQ
jgi:hypothetical protein